MHLDLPPSMRRQLDAFRRRVRIIKIAEGALAAVFGLLISYLVVFGLDRLWDTPGWVRATILLVGTAGLTIWLPLVWHRWVWRTRRLDQIACLLRHRFPRFGDRLLGIIELVRNEAELERSLTLCRAAMKQVAEETRDRDYRDAVPHPRHIRWACFAGGVALVAAAVLVFVPDAGFNALARWLLPFGNTERYTFARLEDLPDSIVVPYAERFELGATLAADSAWTPAAARARYGTQPVIETSLQNGGYEFEFPPQKDPDEVLVSVGDVRQRIGIVPTSRPELEQIEVDVTLPEYLQYTAPQKKDVRGGGVSVVKGSRIRFAVTTTRELAAARMDGQDIPVAGNTITTEAVTINEPVTHEFTWRDAHDLAAKSPFVLSVNAVEDQPPRLSCGRLAREQVLLAGDVLAFQVNADDDFGIKEIGLEWSGIEDPLRNPHPAVGERVVKVGGPEASSLQVETSFSAKTEAISPQTLQLRLYAVDYLEGRERVYSPTYIVHVLSAEEHAIWLTNQLRRWFRQAQDVHEQERRLHEVNKQLRALPADELDRAENRRKIENQAAAESANGRRLSALTTAGKSLIEEATRNDQFNVATLESWAEMLQTLEDIADNRMPSVADLLKQAANAPGGNKPSQPAAGTPQPLTPNDHRVGNVRDNKTGSGGEPAEAEDDAEKPKLPQIVDVESGANEVQEQKKDDEQPPPPPGGSRFSLPSTTVLGGGAPQEDGPPPPETPAQEKVEEALDAQQALLDEFAKVAEELQRILDNLEGSTFVKRLKAAARRQIEVASDLNGHLMGSFGLSSHLVEEPAQKVAADVSTREIAQSENVFVIQQDLGAYFNRVQQGKFKTVLDEMKSTQVVSKIRDIAGIAEENLYGQSMSEAEYWADTLDRWSEQLVGPGCPSGGT